MNKFLVKNPIISEKAVSMAKDHKYVFLVQNDATAPEVKKVVEKTYKVNVIKTNVVMAKPKPKRFGMHASMTPGYKKIIVTLKKGQELDVLPH